MLRHKAYKFRIYPNKEQVVLIVKTIGCSRFLFNHFLNMWNETYKTTKKGLSYNLCSAMLPTLKKNEETSWLREVDSIALQSSVKNLDDSFSRFFRGQNKAPNFKSKSDPVQSYTTKNVNNSIHVADNKIKLPKLGFAKFAKSKELNGRILKATISRKPSGKFFISILCEEEISELPKTHSSIGIDLGITDFAILSDRTKHDNNRFTKRLADKLAREQRKLSRRMENAKKNNIPLAEVKNYQKQKKVVARLHERVANQRNDFLNKLSTDIIKSHDVICIEDLNPKGMLRNHKLAKAISDVSWSAFVTKLKDKADWYGREVITIDRWYPSSQICSSCGHKDGKKPLNIREWTCPVWHVHHDRDVNASINILKEGQKKLA